MNYTPYICNHHLQQGLCLVTPSHKDLRATCLCVVLSCVGTGLATGWSPFQGILPKRGKNESFQKLILNRNMPEGLTRETYNNNNNSHLLLGKYI